MYSGRAISSARPIMKRTSAGARPSVSLGPTTIAVGGCATSATSSNVRIGLQVHRRLAVAEEARAVGVRPRQLGLGHRRDALVRLRRRGSRARGAALGRRAFPQRREHAARAASASWCASSVWSSSSSVPPASSSFGFGAVSDSRRRSSSLMAPATASSSRKRRPPSRAPPRASMFASARSDGACSGSSCRIITRCWRTSASCCGSSP